jgi:hypothetical protein
MWFLNYLASFNTRNIFSEDSIKLVPSEDESLLRFAAV